MSKGYKQNEFRPPWWLSNRHMQSCVNALFKPAAKTLLSWEQLELPDGDFIDLCWSGPRDAPIVVLLHGLEGSVDSHYIQLMLDALVADGWQVVVMQITSNTRLITAVTTGFRIQNSDNFILFYLGHTVPFLHLLSLDFHC